MANLLCAREGLERAGLRAIATNHEVLLDIPQICRTLQAQVLESTILSHASKTWQNCRNVVPLLALAINFSRPVIHDKSFQSQWTFMLYTTDGWHSLSPQSCSSQRHSEWGLLRP